MAPINVNDLEGCYTALITPMLSSRAFSNHIDHKKLANLIEAQIQAGVSGLLVGGTTGQDCTLDHQEQIELAGFVNERVKGRIPLIFGAGSNSTYEAIQLTRGIEEKTNSAQTFLHATGYKNNPTQNGLKKHFNAIADEMDLESNMILYNVPGRTSSYIEPKTILELAWHDNIIGLKQAVDFSTLKYGRDTQEIIKETSPDEFRVLSGEDTLVADLIDMGGYGVISATANVAPKLMQEIATTANHVLQERVNLLVAKVFEMKNPIPLAHMFETELRLPMTREKEMEYVREWVIHNYNPDELGIDLRDFE